MSHIRFLFGILLEGQSQLAVSDHVFSKERVAVDTGSVEDHEDHRNQD